MTTDRRLSALFSFSIILLLASCAPITRYNVTDLPNRIHTQSSKQATGLANNLPQQESETSSERFHPTPSIKISKIAQSLNSGDELQIPGEPVSLNVESLTLPAFINEVFGNILGQSFQIAPRIQDKSDLVTLRVVEPVSRKDLFYTAKQLLETYGVGIVTDDNIIRFVLARSGQSSDAPLFVTGETLPNVPMSHRPIFQVIPLKVVQNNNAINWLKAAFSGQSLKITQDPHRNAIWLQGKRNEVMQAAEVLKMLDQPLMRSRQSLRIEPLFLDAETLTKRLIEVLTAEGYDATLKRTGAINFLPILEANSIIVFSTTQDALEHVKKWVVELDKPLEQVKGDNIYLYRVQNTSAKNITDVLGQLNERSHSKAATKTSTGSAERMNLVVDESKNAILFKGNNEEWATMLPIIKQLDEPALQVLIEVVVAEVQLSEDFSFGIEWAINNASLGDPATAIARNALNIGSGGLSYFPMSNSGSTRAVLNALASNSNVKLLQTPRLLVRSGKEASINVGDEVPIVTAQTTDTGQQVDGNSALTQSVQYRRTGNTLSIIPVVYDGGQLDIEISQEISAAQKTSTSGLDSPTITNRSLNTNLTVKDGGSVLIGGLIQTTDTEGESRVPFLSDIPFLGKLFTQKTINSSRTELMVLVIPYIVRDDNDAAAITKAFQNSLELHN